MERLKAWGIVGLVGMIGMILVGYGLWEQLRPRPVVVEVIKEGEQEQESRPALEVVVDIAGAVQKPGVYRLPSHSRIGDVLVAAGGLSGTADREWVAATLNLASPVQDGEKVFIPDKAASKLASTVNSQTGQGSQKINLNTASLSELDSLEGIGEVRAKKIIESRPYTKVEELVSKAVVPESVYDKIKDRLSVY